MSAVAKQEDFVALCRSAFDEPSPDLVTAQANLKAVANTLLLNEDARQVFVDSGYASKVADKLHVTKARQSMPKGR